MQLTAEQVNKVFRNHGYTNITYATDQGYSIEINFDKLHPFVVSKSNGVEDTIKLLQRIQEDLVKVEPLTIEQRLERLEKKLGVTG